MLLGSSFFCARGYFRVTAGELIKEMIEEYLSHYFKEKENRILKLNYEPALAGVCRVYTTILLAHCNCVHATRI